MSTWGYTDEELASAAEQWKTWAAGLPRNHDLAADAALSIIAAGGTPDEAQAAARLAAGVVFSSDPMTLRVRHASALRVAAELRQQRPGGELTAAAIESMAARYDALAAATEAALGTSAVAAEKGRFKALEVSVTEVVAYAGSIAVLVGLGFLVGFQGQQLGDFGRLAIYVLVTAAALGVGFLFEPRSSRPPIRRARASSLLLGVAALYALTAEASTDLHLLTKPGLFTGQGPDQSGNLMLAAAAATLLAAPLFIRVRAFLLAIATIAATYATAAAFVAWRTSPDPWVNVAAFCAAGAILVGVTELTRGRGAGRWPVEMIALTALATPALAAYAFAPFGTAGLSLLLVGGGIATAASVAAVLRHSPGYALAAALGLLGFDGNVSGHFYGQPWALGLLLLASAVVLGHAERMRRDSKAAGGMEVVLCFLGALAPIPFGLFELPGGLAGLLPLAFLGGIAVAASVAAVWRNNPGYGVASGFGLGIFVIAVPGFLYEHALWAGTLIGIASAVVVAHAERHRILGRRGLGLEFMSFVGLMTPVAFGLSLASGKYQIAFEAIAGFIALGAFAASVARASRGYAVAGGVGLFAFTLTVGFRHFTDSIGFAGVLVASGLVLIGLAFVLARLLPRLRARRAEQVRVTDQLPQV